MIQVDRELLWKVYTAVRVLGGKGGSSRIAELLGVSPRTVQRYLSVLVKAGAVEPVRSGMRVYYRVAKPLTEGDIEELLKNSQKDARVYELARQIKNMIGEAGIWADLIGACKIHLVVPNHSRVTRDIDVVVVREHSKVLTSLLKYGLSLVQEPVAGVHVDYRFEHPVEGVKVDVVVDGFREDGKLVWNLASVLRRRGELTLEHVVVAKLARRSFEYRSDAYDVAVALPHLSVSVFGEVYRELKNSNPELARRVGKHLEIVKSYIDNEFAEDERALATKALKRVKEIVKNADQGSNTLTLRQRA